eukprot:11123361-Alexandrium_andersonii.AAC.1
MPPCSRAPDCVVPELRAALPGLWDYGASEHRISEPSSPVALLPNPVASFPIGSDGSLPSFDCIAPSPDLREVG